MFPHAKGKKGRRGEIKGGRRRHDRRRSYQGKRRKRTKVKREREEEKGNAAP